MNEIPQRVSESVRRRNPHLYGGVGCVEASQPKQPVAPALDRGIKKQKKRSPRLEIVVTMSAHRGRILDDDNNVGSLKPLRDAIADGLGIDDGDPAIKFCCSQIQTRGREGVLVTIERLK